MKKLFFVICCLMLISKVLHAQTGDSDYLKKIDSLETKIQQIKSLPKDQQKQYFSVLSDVENRKNTLKSLLKTPSAKRDKTWEQTWTQNYTKASDKLKNIKLK
ncbi:MAG: hypothetical protein ABI723_25760 [Bacteroidia bacterium]